LLHRVLVSRCDFISDPQGAPGLSPLIARRRWAFVVRRLNQNGCPALRPGAKQSGFRLPVLRCHGRSSSEVGSFCHARRRRNRINNGHPFMNKSDDRSRIDAILRHLGCGGALRDFPGTESEKLALIRIASNRGLVAWHKGRGRYEVSPIGWSELTPRRRFGLGSLMASTAVGATVGAAVLGFFWVSADASRLVGPSPVARAEKAIAAPVAPVPVAAAPAPQTAGASPAAPPLPQAPVSGALAGNPT
jgi:hypothetical protein